MKLGRLTLHNFGIYAGSNHIDFQSEKPVVLIGGMNGQGKTTILEAILLSLYGRRSYAFEESRLPFKKYLTRLVNTSCNASTAKLELECTLTAETGLQKYLITREWDTLTKAPTLKTTILIDDAFSQLLSDNWDLFIEETLPSAIAPFFFFDGEKISNLANSDDDTYMKDSIKALLGINVIESAIADIQRIVKKKGRSAKTGNYSKELMEYDALLSEASDKLKYAIEMTGHLEVKRIQLDNRLKEAESKFVSSGGDLATNRQELLSQQRQLAGYLERTDVRIIDIASGDMPLNMVKPLLKRVVEAAIIENEQRGIQNALEQLPTLFRNYMKSEPSSLDINDFMDYLRGNISDSPPIYNLTENGYLRLKMLCSTLLNDCREDAAQALLQRDKILAKMAEVDNYLTVNVNEHEAEQIYEDILNLTSQYAAVEEQLRSSKVEQAVSNARVEELSRQQARIIEQAVGELESADEEKRILIYAGYSIDVLYEYKVRLQAEKTKQLAETMTKCFRKLVSKNNLLKKIIIDEATLQFRYYDDNGEETSPALFSAGERQLLVISMLWALGICSKKHFPIIVDTPLARLDSIHRETLVTNYFPKASTQTILLSTDEEVYGKLYQLLSPYIGKEYTLKYDEGKKKMNIEAGYYGGQTK